MFQFVFLSPMFTVNLPRNSALQHFPGKTSKDYVQTPVVVCDVRETVGTFKATGAILSVRVKFVRRHVAVFSWILCNNK